MPLFLNSGVGYDVIGERNAGLRLFEQLRSQANFARCLVNRFDGQGAALHFYGAFLS